MPMSVDEKAIMKAYMSRKIRTVPILILMLFSLLPLCSFSFQWACGQLAWHKTDAEVVMVNEDGGGFIGIPAARQKRPFPVHTIPTGS